MLASFSDLNLKENRTTMNILHNNFRKDEIYENFDRKPLKEFRTGDRYGSLGPMKKNQTLFISFLWDFNCDRGAARTQRGMQDLLIDVF
jgi:hypothetical protein